jgi:hypothetical protein
MIKPRGINTNGKKMNVYRILMGKFRRKETARKRKT